MSELHQDQTSTPPTQVKALWEESKELKSALLELLIWCPVLEEYPGFLVAQVQAWDTLRKYP